MRSAVTASDTSGAGVAVDAEQLTSVVQQVQDIMARLQTNVAAVGVAVYAARVPCALVQTQQHRDCLESNRCKFETDPTPLDSRRGHILNPAAKASLGMALLGRPTCPCQIHSSVFKVCSSG
jgi:hypothetical protein